MTRTLALASLLFASGCYVAVNMGNTDGGAGTTGSGSTAGTTSGSPVVGLSCSPTPVDFGSVLVGMSSAQQVTCTNGGSAAALISVNATTTAPQFQVTDANGPVNSATQQTLSPGGSYQFTVAFEPNSVGNFTSSFTVTVCADPSTCANPSPISLNGTGVANANCAAPQANPESYPVKVLFVVDQSGGMCISDPPGSQAIGGANACALACQDLAGVLPGCAPNAQPGRVSAIESAVAQLSAFNDSIEAASPGRQGPVQISVVPFETNVFTNLWPAPENTFETIDSASLSSATEYLNALPSELGNGANFQGALQAAYQQIAADISSQTAQQLAKTTYEVVFVAGGTPYPICTSTQTLDGGLTLSRYADPFTDPSGVWTDNPASYCLLAPGQVDCGANFSGPNCYSGPSGDPAGVNNYVFGSDLNQNAQLLGLVDAIVSLAQDAGAVATVHTALLMAAEGIPAVAEDVNLVDVEGDYPNIPVTDETEAAYSAAGWLLSQMAQHGGGLFLAAPAQSVQGFSLLQLPIGPLGCGVLDAGAPAGCALSVNPATVQFLGATVGNALESLATLTDVGSGACNISGVALGATSDPSFALATNQATGFTIPAGGSATIAVEFNLNNDSLPLTRTGAIDFASNDPSHANGTVPLTATLSTSPGGGTDAGYTIYAINTGVPGQTQFAMAIGPDDQVGVAYFLVPDGGTTADLVFAEIQSGGLFTSPECLGNDCGIPNIAGGLETGQLQLGLTVAYASDGTAAIGHLGGAAYSSPDDTSSSWIQSQAEIDYLSQGDILETDLCMLSSTGGSCQEPSAACTVQDGTDNGFDWKIYDGNPPAEDAEAEQLCNNPSGEIVGLWPSLLFDGGTAVMTFRDVHEGPVQDYGASDAKTCLGGPGGTSWSYSAPLTVSASGSHTANGFGLHNQMIYANGLLAVIGDSDSTDQGAEDTGAGPINFTIQTTNGGQASYTGSSNDWTQPLDPFFGLVVSSGTGPSMVYSPTAGFAAVATDVSTTTPELYFTSCSATPVDACADAGAWGSPLQFANVNESVGFFPQIVINPVTGGLEISSLNCSRSAGVTPETGCNPSWAGIQVAAQVSPSSWAYSQELPGAFWHPRFGYLSTGKKVFVYGDMVNGGLYVAIEN